MAQSGIEFNFLLFWGIIPNSTAYHINNTEDIGGMTPLHWLCIKYLCCDTIEQRDNLDTIKWLLSQGAETDTMTDTLSYTPLHLLALGRDPEEREMSLIWTHIKEQKHNEMSYRDEEAAIKNGVRVILENGGRIIANRTHGLTPLGLFMMRLGRDDMEIENVLEFFPVSLRVRDLFELTTIKLCEFRNTEILLKIASLSIKHGYGYLRSLDWNVSGLSRLMTQECDQLILVYTNETFKGKLLPDYIPIVLPIGEQNRNEIFPLRNTDLLDEMKDSSLVFRRFGMEGLKAALNLIVCEESMYISFEDLFYIYNKQILALAGEYSLELFEEIFHVFVETAIDRFKIKQNSKGLNNIGAACMQILLGWLDIRREDKHTVKLFINTLTCKYRMEAILHSVLDMLCCDRKQYRVVPGELSYMLVNFEWRVYLSVVLEFLDTQINCFDADGNTCLHIAVNHTDVRTATELLSWNAYPYAKNNNGITCIEIMREIVSDREYGKFRSLKNKVSLLDSSPPMLKVLAAESITRHCIEIQADTLATGVRNILVLHRYKYDSPPGQLL